MQSYGKARQSNGKQRHSHGAAAVIRTYADNRGPPEMYPLQLALFTFGGRETKRPKQLQAGTAARRGQHSKIRTHHSNRGRTRSGKCPSASSIYKSLCSAHSDQSALAERLRELNASVVAMSVDRVPLAVDAGRGSRSEMLRGNRSCRKQPAPCSRRRTRRWVRVRPPLRA
jgi:hypothetical protein